MCFRYVAESVQPPIARFIIRCLFIMNTILDIPKYTNFNRNYFKIKMQDKSFIYHYILSIIDY